MDLNLTMFGKNANKILPLEMQKIELLEINQSINKGSNDNFKKFGTVEKIVLVEFTNKNGTFNEYLFNDVFEVVKNNKNIKFIAFFNAISAQKNKLNVFIENAKSKKYSENIFLNIDQLKIHTR